MKPAKKSPTGQGPTSPQLGGTTSEPGTNMTITLGGAPLNEPIKDVEMSMNNEAAAEKGDRQKMPTDLSGPVVEDLEVNGDIPQARFGHTITIVSKAKVVLFGGATGDTGKYSMTGETFMYNILNKAWQKLTGK